jgi:hypothetical protein
MYQKTKKALQHLECGITHQARINLSIQASISGQQPAAALTAGDFRLSEVKEIAG